MAKTAAQQQLDRVIGGGLGPALKADGFRKSGHTWRRTRERCVEVVNLQASQSSAAEALKFTINLGVFYPEVHAAARDFLRWAPGPAGPKEYECTLRTRIGGLLPGGLDHWWSLRAADRPEPVAREVERVYRDHARPWLDAMADFETARRTGAKFMAPAMLAAFALAAGDRAEAARILTEFLAERPQASAIADWARKLGLLT